MKKKLNLAKETIANLDMNVVKGGNITTVPNTTYPETYASCQLTCPNTHFSCEVDCLHVPSDPRVCMSDVCG
ncbi:MAG: hypothetical protein ACEPOV_02115 [Hyphomicrobiales bacterium]